MADQEHADQPNSRPTEGIWILNDTENHLRFVTEEQMAHEARELTADRRIPNDPTPPETIANYLSGLSGPRKEMRDALRNLGWAEPDIYDLLSFLENSQKRLSAQLQMQGCNELEIERLNARCEQDVTDLSHLRRPLADRGEEDYQAQLYLLGEVERRRRVMLGEN